MIPFGNETVTLVQRMEGMDVNGRTAVTYSTVLLTGCSWRRRERIARISETIMFEEEIVCRIPADQTRPKPGDLLILGDVAVSITTGAQYQQLIERYRDSDGAFVVASVKDNARPGMPLSHYLARG